ncbi:HD domain protein [uncultured archaeon]|nr:HD domain protein [uncultured archaeon]
MAVEPYCIFKGVGNLFSTLEILIKRPYSAFFGMVHLSQDFIEKITNHFFRTPYEPLPYAAEIFSFWHTQSPGELERIANSVDVSIDDLKKGDVVSAMKVINEDKDPLRQIAEYFSDPMNCLRMETVKPLSEEARTALKKSYLEKLLRDVPFIDATHSTPDLVTATSTVLRLFGFIEVDNHWQAYCNGSAPEEVEFKQITSTPIALPYDDYMLKLLFTRGFNEMELVIHHPNIDAAREGTFNARTLLGNTKILDLPVLDVSALPVRYCNALHDPLSMAFNDGFMVYTGKYYAYNLRLIIDGLTKKLSVPAHRYFFMRQIYGDTDKISRPDISDLVHDIEFLNLKIQTGQAVPSRDRSVVERVQDVQLDFQKGKVSVDLSMYAELLNTETFKRMRGVKSLGNLANTEAPYAQQSRFEHCVGTLHVARAMCRRFGIKGYDQIKTEVYALLHDSGHLTGSHATEDYFRARSGFDHDKFAIELLRQNKGALEGIVDVEDIVAMFEHRDPLHLIVDGPFGADRIYFLSIDPHE